MSSVIRSVLAVNAGSASLQVSLVRLGDDCPDGTVLAEHDSVEGALDGLAEPPDAVGHRLVHGGDVVTRPAVVTDEVVAAVGRYAGFAPLHVPPALDLLATLRTRLPDRPHVLCPDTAFHAGLPESARVDALPAQWRERYGLRRYGFHGLSYAWALSRAAALLERDATELRLVLAHLGGGCSVTAVDRGRSVATSMGTTPLDGVPMSTRSGAVDPGVLLWLIDSARCTPADVAHGLERESGLLGLSGGRSGDTRELVRMAGDAGDPRSAAAARFALDVFCRRVAAAVAGAATALDGGDGGDGRDGLDALVFTGEIGWDQPEVRQGVCARLGVLGVPGELDGNRDSDGPVSRDGAAVPVLVVRTREELQIARETAAVLAVGS
jgi:acetate kinase